MPHPQDGNGKKGDDNMKIKIEDVPMSQRLKNCLTRHGIRYLEEIFDYTDEDYFKVKHIGRKAIYEAQQIVLQYKSQRFSQ